MNDISVNALYAETEGDIPEENARIVYIEPNEIFGLKEVSGIDYAKSENVNLRRGVGDNITLKNEDLTMSVDLQVIIPERTKAYQMGKEVLVSEAQTNKWASLMGGSPIEVHTNGKTYYELTTNYTEATYSEVRMDGYSQREMLNIRDISITFGAYFYPEVTMTMVDVRGFALMMPSEDLFRHNILEEMGETDAEAKGSFFRSLFHIPYPRFLLTIKGYYGKPVTFNLCVSTFNTAFDSKTGDFVVTIKFIGYMLGLYADLPFNLLLVAPYIGMTTSLDYTNNSSERTQTGPYWNRDNFKYVPGTAWYDKDESMMTFVDFFQKMTKIRVDNTTEASIVKRAEDNVSLLGTYLSALGGLKSAIREFLDNFDNNHKLQRVNGGQYTWDDVTEFIRFYKINPQKEKFKVDGTALKNLYDSFSLYENRVKEYINKVEDIVGENGFNALGAQKDFGFEILKAIFSYYNFEKPKQGKNGEYSLELKLSDIFGLYNKEECVTRFKDNIPDEVRLKIVGNGSNILGNADVKGKPYLHFYDYCKYISTLENVVDKKMEFLKKDVQYKKSLMTIDALGFLPTIRNMFRMFFAHINAFTSSFYALLNRIEDHKGERKLSELKLSIDETDMVNGSGNDDFLAPFPMVYKETQDKNGMEVYYPGENPRLQNLDEVKYVDDLVGVIFGVKERINDIIKDVSGDLEAMNKKMADFEKRIEDIRNNPAYIPGGGGGGDDYPYSGNGPRSTEDLKSNERIFVIDQLKGDFSPYAAAYKKAGKTYKTDSFYTQTASLFYVGILRSSLALMNCRSQEDFEAVLEREAAQCLGYIEKLGITFTSRYKETSGKKIISGEINEILQGIYKELAENFVKDNTPGKTLYDQWKINRTLLYKNATPANRESFISWYPYRIKNITKGEADYIKKNNFSRYAHRNNFFNDQLKGHSHDTCLLGATKDANNVGLTFINHQNWVTLYPTTINTDIPNAKTVTLDGITSLAYDIKFDENKFNPWLICADASELLDFAKTAKSKTRAQNVFTTIRGTSVENLYCWPMLGACPYNSRWFINKNKVKVGGNYHETNILDSSNAKNVYLTLCDSYNSTPKSFSQRHYMPTANFGKTNNTSASNTTNQWSDLIKVVKRLWFFEDKNAYDNIPNIPFGFGESAIATYTIPELLLIYEKTKNEAINLFLTNWASSTYLSTFYGANKEANLDFVHKAFFEDLEGDEWGSANTWTKMDNALRNNSKTLYSAVLGTNGPTNLDRFNGFLGYCNKSAYNSGRIAFFLERFDFASVYPRCNMKFESGNAEKSFTEHFVRPIINKIRVYPK